MFIAMQRVAQAPYEVEFQVIIFETSSIVPVASSSVITNVNLFVQEHVMSFHAFLFYWCCDQWWKAEKMCGVFSQLWTQELMQSRSEGGKFMCSSFRTVEDMKTR